LPLRFSRACTRFRGFVRGTLPIVALACLLAGPATARAQSAALAAEAQPSGPTVAAIEVEGNRRVEIDAIKAAMVTKVGSPVDTQSIQQDIRGVMKLGYFSDVAIAQKGTAERPVLVVQVVEKPSVQDFKIEGNDELSADDLKDAIEIKRYAILDMAAVRKTVKKIQEKYTEKGFYLADVTWRLDDRPDNQVVVVFVVNERAKVQVRRIHFVGNEHISKEEILPYMQTQEGSYLAFLSSAGTYKEDAFQRDLQAIQAVYLEKG
jgi:outer membrane protein insertion porin family